ncbi:hypothetical protein B0T21DRAFT_353383 [Apiosordaria backusii]|uniref:Uncharacterized protein n=1 Tax=Apiosordaria backusii TaxID=314023 RepID=A0AA39ZSR4_9PEZI|nr:hypothetical protein B0T21DRAFT_353383 [Apiosordaria backusii]
MASEQSQADSGGQSVSSQPHDPSSPTLPPPPPLKRRIYCHQGCLDRETGQPRSFSRAFDLLEHQRAFHDTGMPRRSMLQYYAELRAKHKQKHHQKRVVAARVATGFPPENFPSQLAATQSNSATQYQTPLAPRESSQNYHNQRSTLAQPSHSNYQHEGPSLMGYLSPVSTTARPSATIPVRLDGTLSTSMSTSETRGIPGMGGGLDRMMPPQPTGYTSTPGPMLRAHHSTFLRQGHSRYQHQQSGLMATALPLHATASPAQTDRVDISTSQTHGMTGVGGRLQRMPPPRMNQEHSTAPSWSYSQQRHQQTGQALITLSRAHLQSMAHLFQSPVPTGNMAEDDQADDELDQ